MNDTEALKDFARRWVAAMNAHDLDALTAMAREDLVNHAALPEAQGVSGLRRIVDKLFRAMPDLRWELSDVVAEGDRVVCRVQMTGTQTGALEFVRFPLPATGRRVSTEQIHILRIADGKVVEHWAGRDDLGMLRQLGHLPFGAKEVA